MSESVRMCGLEDADQLCEIIKTELGYTEVTADDVRFSLEQMLGNDDYFNLAIESGGEILGFISSVREFTFERGKIYRILALAVKEDHQRQKLGTALITLIESKARSENASLVTLSSRFKRTGAHEFYEKLGYEKTSNSFKKKLV